MVLERNDGGLKEPAGWTSIDGYTIHWTEVIRDHFSNSFFLTKRLYYKNEFLTRTVNFNRLKFYGVSEKFFFASSYLGIKV